MSQLLVDSSTWILSQLPQTEAPFLAYLNRAGERHEIFTTGIIRLEVMTGMRTWEELLLIQEQFEALAQMEPTHDTWTDAGRLGMRLHKKGVHVGTADLLIASIALEHRLTLVHADRDFELIAKHEKLKTESLLHLVR